MGQLRGRCLQEAGAAPGEKNSLSRLATFFQQSKRPQWLSEFESSKPSNSVGLAASRRLENRGSQNGGSSSSKVLFDNFQREVGQVACVFLAKKGVSVSLSLCGAARRDVKWSNSTWNYQLHMWACFVLMAPSLGLLEGAITSRG